MAIASILKKVFGSKADRDLKQIRPILNKVLEAYGPIDKLTNDELRAKTEELKARLRDCEAPFEKRIAEIKAKMEEDIPVHEKESLATESDKLVKDEDAEIERVLDEVLPEAFAIMKSTARRFKENATIEVTANDFDRALSVNHDFVHIEGDKAVYQNHWVAGGNEVTWDMVHYDVQLIGGIVLHQGKIAEMATGEGKTLVATLPVFLNALAGKGVHVVTVNDYLSKRDSEWMGKVHRFLGLTVGLIVHDLTSEERRKAYAADITYGTNNEMGFDYLRDNMAIYASELVQRGHAFAIVDEVDSILIDEARTPLIISGMGEKSTEMYSRTENLVRGFRKKVIAESDDKEEEDVNVDADYIVDEKAKTATLTARGVKKAEEYFGLENLSDPENSTIAHHINQAIKAHGTMKRDIDISCGLEDLKLRVDIEKLKEELGRYEMASLIKEVENM